MADSLHPSDGVRLLLERVSEEDTGARYVARVYTPSAVFEYAGTLGFDGDAALEPVAERAEQWAETQLVNLAKLTARAAARKRDDGLLPWPGRITRWRGPGRGR